MGRATTRRKAFWVVRVSSLYGGRTQGPWSSRSKRTKRREARGSQASGQMELTRRCPEDDRERQRTERARGRPHQLQTTRLWRVGSVRRDAVRHRRETGVRMHEVCIEIESAEAGARIAAPNLYAIQPARTALGRERQPSQARVRERQRRFARSVVGRESETHGVESRS